MLLFIKSLLSTLSFFVAAFSQIFLAIFFWQHLHMFMGACMCVHVYVFVSLYLAMQLHTRHTHIEIYLPAMAYPILEQCAHTHALC